MMPLEGIRVLDLSRLAPGPYCSMLLGDLGADVLLLEAPPQLVSRSGAPQQAADEEADRRQAFNALRRNKRSIVLNLREQAGRDVFYRLCENVDIVLEGFRPGVVDRLGVDHETLAKINPRIVYCSLSGYGQDGPYRDMVGHDINYISIGGALGMIGRPGQKPAIPMNVLADFAGGGLMAAFAILAAVIARQQTGRGQYIDSAMSDGVLYLLASTASGVLAGADAPRPGEAGLTGAVPHYDVYECADGRWLSIGALEPHFWDALCEAVGRDDFKPHQQNRERHPEIREQLERSFRSATRDQWFERLRGLDICVAPVLALDEALKDPHNLARQMVIEVEDERFGPVQQVGIGPKLSDTPGRVRSTGPRPGQDGRRVLEELGYTEEQIEALRAQEVLG